MYRVIVVLSLFVIACQDRGGPLEPVGHTVEDGPVQLADIRGHELTANQMERLLSQVRAAKSTQSPTDSMLAWLEPDPYGAGSFDELNLDEMDTWKTFTVRTRRGAGIDSLYIMVNLRNPWNKPIFEIAGGSVPPDRSYCPAEWNDLPSRPRRNSWNVHLSVCSDNLQETQLGNTDGETVDVWSGSSEYILYGIEDGELKLYGFRPLWATFLKE